MARLKIRGTGDGKGGRAMRGRSPKEKREVTLRRRQSGVVLRRWPGFESTSSTFFLTFDVGLIGSWSLEVCKALVVFFLSFFLPALPIRLES
jgi:hypothetical protein